MLKQLSEERKGRTNKSNLFSPLSPKHDKINDVLVNSPNLAPYFLYKQFGRICLFNFHSFLHLISFLFLITSYIILFELCKEKLDVDKLLGAERVKEES